MTVPVWDYSELIEEAKDRIEEKLMIEGDLQNEQNSNQLQ